MREHVENRLAPPVPAREFASSAVAGFYTLFYKEWLRFWKVAVQTVLAPVLSALLFLLVFGHTLRGSLEPYPGVPYGAFLAPGLAMMSVLQNAFANASSSLMQSKMTGNIIFVLLPSFSHRLSLFNPIFYMIDGFRYSFFGNADVSPWLSFAIVVAGFLALSFLTLRLFRVGYKLRH